MANTCTCFIMLEYESFCWLLGATITYNLSSFYFGYSMVYFNATDYPILEKMFSIDLDRGVGEGILSGCIAFGAIFGAAFQRAALSILGRKFNQLNNVGNAFIFLMGLQ